MGASRQPTSLRCRSSAFEPSLALPPAATRKRNCNRGLPTARGRNTRRSSRPPRRLSWESGGGGGFRRRRAQRDPDAAATRSRPTVRRHRLAAAEPRRDSAPPHASWRAAPVSTVPDMSARRRRARTGADGQGGGTFGLLGNRGPPWKAAMTAALFTIAVNALLMARPVSVPTKRSSRRRTCAPRQVGLASGEAEIWSERSHSAQMHFDHCRCGLRDETHTAAKAWTPSQRTLRAAYALLML